MEEKILEVKPSWIITLPHIILMFFWIGFITIWNPLISMFTIRLTITNKRVEGKTGLIKTEVMDSRLKQITSVKVTQGLMGKIFNYGKVNINTASGNYEFRYMPRPNYIRQIINKQIDISEEDNNNK